MRKRALLSAAAVVAATLTAPAPAQAATLAQGTVLGAGLPGTIAGRYIVTMAGMSAASAGGAPTGRSYTASMSAAAARRLAARPGVAAVEQDRVVHIEGLTQRNPVWGLDRIDQRPVAPSHTYTPMDDGSAVHAYVIDTGIRITHDQFAGRASYGWDFVDNDAVASDCNGHGTHVAGTIGGKDYGVAKDVRLVAVKVLDCDGDGLLSDVINGVNWVTAHAVKPAVANMSMGGTYSPALNAAVQRSINSGVTYVVAAGNEDQNAAKSSPASLAAAITVGATDSSDQRASFSNFGAGLDLFAPGVGVRSSVADSDTATAVYSGTSMASPHVAGAAALVLDAYPADTPAQVRDYLVARATTGKVGKPAGSPNRLLFVPAPSPAAAITSSRLNGSQGVAFRASLAESPSRRGTWSVASGSLPAGLTLSAGGLITGTPTAPGTSAVVVRFTDYIPNVTNRQVTFAVAATAPVISPVLATRVNDAAYSSQLTVTDGRAGTWDLADGALPNGLSLSSDGVISGLASDDAPATFTVRFTDAFGTTATHTFTL